MKLYEIHISGGYTIWIDDVLQVYAHSREEAEKKALDMVRETITVSNSIEMAVG